MNNTKQTWIESPFGRTIGFATSVLLSGVLASAFVTEITVQGQLEWSIFYTKKTFWALIILMFAYLVYYVLTSREASTLPTTQGMHRLFSNAQQAPKQGIWTGITSLPGWVIAMALSLYFAYHYKYDHFTSGAVAEPESINSINQNNYSEACDMKVATRIAMKLLTDDVEDPERVTIENIYCIVVKVPEASWAVWARSPSQGRIVFLVDEKTSIVKANIVEPHPPGVLLSAHRFMAVDFDGNGIDEVVLEEALLHHGYSYNSLDVLNTSLKPLVSFVLLDEDLGIKRLEDGGYEYRAEARMIGRNKETIIEIIPKDMKNITASYFKLDTSAVAVKKRTRFIMHNGKFSPLGE